MRVETGSLFSGREDIYLAKEAEVIFRFNTVNEQRREVFRLARAILDGSVGIISGAREIADVHLYSGHTGQEIDADYIFFVNLSRKTDHLPLGDVRMNWGAAALLRVDAEIREIEDSNRETAIQAARNLVLRFDE